MSKYERKKYNKNYFKDYFEKNIVTRKYYKDIYNGNRNVIKEHTIVKIDEDNNNY